MWSSQLSHSFHSAAWSRFVHISTAASMPMISSLPTFMDRPKAWCGALQTQAVCSRSFCPSSSPAACGPRRHLPPLYATMFAPFCRWMLGILSSSAAASTITGTLCFRASAQAFGIESSPFSAAGPDMIITIAVCGPTAASNCAAVSTSIIFTPVMRTAWS